MERTGDVPEIVLVRVETPGGPFAAGDKLAIAFNDPEIGRIAMHYSLNGGERTPAPQSQPIPESIRVVVTLGAEPYARDDVLALWFVDPRFSRIVRGTTVPRYDAPAGARQRAEIPVESDKAAALAEAADAGSSGDAVASVRAVWSSDRVRRFVQVADRLFTVDRLGWYRHALAMRLLLPDEVLCGDPGVDAAANEHLRALRDAAAETLGQPLLAAFMPNFSVTAEWLETLDAPATARSLAQLRHVIAPHGAPRATRIDLSPDRTAMVATIEAAELSATSDLSLDAILPVFIPYRSFFPELTARLSAYRRSLIDLFGQTASSAKLVRLTQMAEPCHALDDRLWQLVGAMTASFVDRAPA